jgi:anti-sigma-K factor RskA
VRYENPELRERLAAEYVLGTMPDRSRRRFERLMAGDSELARIVAAWADRLTPIDMAIPAEEPAARVWQAIEARILATAAPPTAPHHWVGSLAFWRGLAIAGCAAAAALIIYVAAFTGRTGPSIPTVVAVLADQGGDPSWIAIAGPDKGEVLVCAIRSQPGDTRHSFELWGITDGTPRPLGLLQPQPGSMSAISAAQLPPPGDLLAVSLEPPNGSPTALPTGPVLARGKVLVRPQ